MFKTDCDQVQVTTVPSGTAAAQSGRPGRLIAGIFMKTTSFFIDAHTLHYFVKPTRLLPCNASRLTHAELDECEVLDDGDSEKLANQYKSIVASMPWLSPIKRMSTSRPGGVLEQASRRG